MGRRTMNDLKNLARFLVLALVMSWCVASAGAAQQQRPQPPQRPIRPAAAAAHPTHPTTHVTHAAGKMGMMRPRPLKGTPPQQVVAKKPTQEEVKPRPAEVPAVPTAAALAAQAPAFPESGHGRDPFAALIRPSDPSDSHINLPQGIPGLQVATVRLEGMIKTSDGVVAVVANPQDSVYFLHDGDHIYDGVVEKIGLDDITFRQESKDAFGRAVDRNVSKRLYPMAGDEQ